MKKVVQDLTSGGIDWQREKWQSGLGSKFIHQGEKNAAKYADEVIVLSKGVQDYFKETYGRETHFIPNGVNRPQIREASLITDKFGLKKDSYILFLGRLVPEKGIRYLVEAFKNVKTDKKLVIAGGSSDTDSFMEELKELAKGEDRILFTGFVQGAMLDELYSNAYIYTLPSDLEGMPLSLLEAMSYGNCCLVSDIPECAEVVEDKALIFKKSDVENLREKLQDACDHPEMVMKMKNQAADFIDGIRKFKRISARDDLTEQLVEQVTGNAPKRVLDPTFLAEFPRAELKAKRKPYILFYYCENLPENILNQIFSYAKEHGLAVYGAGECDKRYSEVTVNLTPFEWVEMFRNAEFVFTGTFHGAVFSILNRRQFKVYLTNESRIKKVTALLSELQITNRPIKEDFCFDLESMKSEINYEKVYDVIEQNRQSSKQYLKDAIGMAKK